MSDSEPLLPILNNPTRRTAVKGLAATLGLAAFGKAVWPLTNVPAETSLDEFLQKHCKELDEQEKADVFARLEREAK